MSKVEYKKDKYLRLFQKLILIIKINLHPNLNYTSLYFKKNKAKLKQKRYLKLDKQFGGDPII